MNYFFSFFTAQKELYFFPFLANAPIFTPLKNLFMEYKVITFTGIGLTQHKQINITVKQFRFVCRSQSRFLLKMHSFTDIFQSFFYCLSDSIYLKIFQSNLIFLQKNPITGVFLMFSVGIEMDHLLKMG